MKQTKKQLEERLQKLWIKASSSCGAAPAELVAEIQELERRLDELSRQTT